jgi:lipoyl(octanoyl) transferase
MGITAERRADMPGLWVEGRKILSLGVGARRWVTMHGVAFNIAPDLRFFDMIHPCGEVGARVTSLEKLIGEAPPLGEVAESLSPVCRDVFGQEFIWTGEATAPFFPLTPVEGGRS